MDFKQWTPSNGLSFSSIIDLARACARHGTTVKVSSTLALKVTTFLHLISLSVLSFIVFTLSESNQITAGFIVGSSVMGGNLLVLVWAWGRIIEKKAIALAATVIVVKYAIFGAIIYFVVTQPGLSTVGFLLGFSSMVPTLVGLVFFQKRSV